MITSAYALPQIEPARSSLRLAEKLHTRISPDAVALARSISLAIDDAATRTMALYARRQARLLYLLSADAFNARRSDRSRQLRWRRFMNVLAPFALETRSVALLRLVIENADLLNPDGYFFYE